MHDGTCCEKEQVQSTPQTVFLSNSFQRLLFPSHDMALETATLDTHSRNLILNSIAAYAHIDGVQKPPSNIADCSRKRRH